MITDAFATLGLPRSFTLDLTEVERRYLEHSRRLHPDYHGEAGDAEKQASLRLTAELNEAYMTLKDPYRRLDHLVKLHNGPTAAEEKNLDQMFLMEMMELRERIDEAKAGGGTAELEVELQLRLRSLVVDAGKPFDLDAEVSQKTLTQTRRQLNCAKTLMSLLRDLEPGDQE